MSPCAGLPPGSRMAPKNTVRPAPPARRMRVCAGLCPVWLASTGGFESLCLCLLRIHGLLCFFWCRFNGLRFNALRFHALRFKAVPFSCSVSMVCFNPTRLGPRAVVNYYCRRISLLLIVDGRGRYVFWHCRKNKNNNKGQRPVLF